ncbi:MAG: KDO2-lipid lauroyltransferase, partial [Modestobacter sp.]|nr:KDO2-lipid lauroyltransferase [Modestobacter sp.]
MIRAGDLRERLADAGYAAGWGAVKRLPEPVARGAFAVTLFVLLDMLDG